MDLRKQRDKRLQLDEALLPERVEAEAEAELTKALAIRAHKSVCKSKKKCYFPKPVRRNADRERSRPCFVSKQRHPANIARRARNVAVAVPRVLSRVVYTRIAKAVQSQSDNDNEQEKANAASLSDVDELLGKRIPSADYVKSKNVWQSFVRHRTKTGVLHRGFARTGVDEEHKLSFPLCNRAPPGDHGPLTLARGDPQGLDSVSLPATPKGRVRRAPTRRRKMSWRFRRKKASAERAKRISSKLTFAQASTWTLLTRSELYKALKSSLSKVERAKKTMAGEGSGRPPSRSAASLHGRSGARRPRPMSARQNAASVADGERGRQSSHNPNISLPCIADQGGKDAALSPQASSCHGKSVWVNPAQLPSRPPELPSIPEVSSPGVPLGASPAAVSEVGEVKAKLPSISLVEELCASTWEKWRTSLPSLMTKRDVAARDEPGQAPTLQIHVSSGDLCELKLSGPDTQRARRGACPNDHGVDSPSTEKVHEKSRSGVRKGSSFTPTGHCFLSGPFRRDHKRLPESNDHVEGEWLPQTETQVGDRTTLRIQGCRVKTGSPSVTSVESIISLAISSSCCSKTSSSTSTDSSGWKPPSPVGAKAARSSSFRQKPRCAKADERRTCTSPWSQALPEPQTGPQEDGGALDPQGRQEEPAAKPVLRCNFLRTLMEDLSPERSQEPACTEAERRPPSRSSLAPGTPSTRRQQRRGSARREKKNGTLRGALLVRPVCLQPQRPVKAVQHKA